MVQNLLELSGECNIDVLQHGKVSLETTVAFEAITINVPNLEIISYSDDDECLPPSETITINGKLYCKHPCSHDEVSLF